VAIISKRYIELYEKVIGEIFTPHQQSKEETFLQISAALKKL
jgi:hypothetical protein